ncbi:MAG: hypothetical protein AAFW00_09565 [Bacteroidota bacterium]
MNEYKQQLEDITAIRQMMAESTRFLSLSGLSGVSAGIVALIGAAVTYLYLEGQGLYGQMASRSVVITVKLSQLATLVLIALGILLIAATLAFVFTRRNAQKRGQRLWSPSSRKVLLNMLIPLVAGALFCILLTYHGFGKLVGPATLIFYGLALVNAGKYTHQEIYQLGLVEIGLGLVSGMMPGSSIIFWAIGFGVLHILYGIIMYFKYERQREGSPQ